MVRSWAYILMFAATLAGLVALVWPSPKVQTIEEIAMPVRTAPPRAESPPKAAKAAAKPAAKREPSPPPPAVVKQMPATNTTTRRQLAQPENGMQPNPLSRLGQEAREAAKEAAKEPAARPPAPPTRDAPPRPSMLHKPGTKPERNPGEK